MRAKQRNISSLRDLKEKKLEVRDLIDQKEAEIRMEYRDLKDRLSFRNIVGSVSRDIAASNQLIGKAFIVGKFLIERHKKRKLLKQVTGKR